MAGGLRFERLKRSDLEEFAHRVAEELDQAHTLTTISNLLLGVDLASSAKKVAERALELSGRRWRTMYDGGVCHQAAMALVRSDPSDGPRLAFQRWTADVLSGDTGIPERFEEIDELTQIFCRAVPHKELWDMLRVHFLESAEVKYNNIRPFQLTEDASSLQPGTFALTWMEQACEFSLPELEDEAFRAVWEVGITANYDNALITLLGRWFVQNEMTQTRAVALLSLIYKSRKEFALRFADQIQSLRNADSITLRISAERLASNLELSQPRVRSQPLNLSPLYTLILPPI